MEILWWLAPPVVATVVAMAWVSWLGRDGRGAVDRELAVRRLAKAMSRPTKVAPRATSRPTRPGERGTGVAVRSSSRGRPATPVAPFVGPVVGPVPPATPAATTPESTPATSSDDAPTRRAS